MADWHLFPKSTIIKQIKNIRCIIWLTAL